MCGIRADDGRIECWGALGAGVPEGTAFEHLAVGGDFVTANADSEQGPYSHACVLRKEDKRLLCWGDDTVGQLSGAPSLLRYRQLDSALFPAFGHHDPRATLWGLRERDGRALRWGDQTPGFINPGPVLSSESYSSIDLWCGILAANGRADCGEMPPDIELAEVSALSNTSCGIRADDHTVVCWGAGTDPVVSEAPRGVALHGLVTGLGHACALRNDDQHALCWGEDSGGAISDMPADVAFRQLQVERDDDALLNNGTAGMTCGIRESDSILQCWGTQDGISRRPVVPLWKVAKNGGCGLLAGTHEVVCDDLNPPTIQVPGTPFREVTNSHNIYCGIREADSLLTCWGSVLWNPL